MLKPASSNCNLACEYCFYHSLSSKRTDFSKGFMSDDTAKRVVDSALEFADSTDVYFTFQGGEPQKELLTVHLNLRTLPMCILHFKEESRKKSC